MNTAKALQTLPVTPSQIRELISCARLSPSPTNNQPWQYRWNGKELAIYHVVDKGKNMVNADNWLSTFSLGFVLESLRIAASQMSFSPHVVLDPTKPEFTPWATMTFGPSTAVDPLADVVERRMTDRRNYNGGGLFEKVFRDCVGDSRQFTGCHLHFIAPTAEIAEWVAESETLLWIKDWMKQDLIRWIRFTKKEITEAHDGMPWQSLDISFMDSRVLLRCRNPRFQRLVNVLGFIRSMKSRIRERIFSSAGLGCLTLENTEFRKVVEAGQFGMRAWLRLNQQNYAFQPFTLSALSIFYKEVGIIPEAEMEEPIPELVKRGTEILRHHFSLSPLEVPLWLFRTGVSLSAPPRCRTPRRKVSDLLAIEGE